MILTVKEAYRIEDKVLDCHHHCHHRFHQRLMPDHSRDPSLNDENKLPTVLSTQDVKSLEMRGPVSLLAILSAWTLCIKMQGL